MDNEVVKTGTFNISPSLIKKFRAYQRKELCGHIFREVHLMKKFSTPRTDAMDMGNYFEYICTGAIPRDGVIPDMKMTAKKEPTAPYKNLHEQKKNFQVLYEDIEILGTGVVLEFDKWDFHFKGVLDVTALQKLSTQIRDIKTGDVYSDRPYGWGWSYRNPFYKKDHYIQGQFYTWQWRELYGEIPGFYFDVFSTSNPDDFEALYLPFNDYHLDTFEEQVHEDAISIRGDFIRSNFEPLPEFKRCKECKEIKNATGESLHDACPFKALRPLPLTVPIL
jgi:hypothetical protein